MFQSLLGYKPPDKLDVAIASAIKAYNEARVELDYMYGRNYTWIRSAPKNNFFKNDVEVDKYGGTKRVVHEEMGNASYMSLMVYALLLEKSEMPNEDNRDTEKMIDYYFIEHVKAQVELRAYEKIISPDMWLHEDLSILSVEKIYVSRRSEDDVMNVYLNIHDEYLNKSSTDQTFTQPFFEACREYLKWMMLERSKKGWIKYTGEPLVVEDQMPPPPVAPQSPRALPAAQLVPHDPSVPIREVDIKLADTTLYTLHQGIMALRTKQSGQGVIKAVINIFKWSDTEVSLDQYSGHSQEEVEKMQSLNKQMKEHCDGHLKTYRERLQELKKQGGGDEEYDMVNTSRVQLILFNLELVMLRYIDRPINADEIDAYEKEVVELYETPTRGEEVLRVKYEDLHRHWKNVYTQTRGDAKGYAQQVLTFLLERINYYEYQIGHVEQYIVGPDVRDTKLADIDRIMYNYELGAVNSGTYDGKMMDNMASRYMHIVMQLYGGNVFDTREFMVQHYRRTHREFEKLWQAGKVLEEAVEWATAKLHKTQDKQEETFNAAARALQTPDTLRILNKACSKDGEQDDYDRVVEIWHSHTHGDGDNAKKRLIRFLNWIEDHPDKTPRLQHWVTFYRNRIDGNHEFCHVPGDPAMKKEDIEKWGKYCQDLIRDTEADTIPLFEILEVILPKDQAIELYKRHVARYRELAMTETGHYRQLYLRARDRYAGRLRVLAPPSTVDINADSFSTPPTTLVSSTRTTPQRSPAVPSTPNRMSPVVTAAPPKMTPVVPSTHNRMSPVVTSTSTPVPVLSPVVPTVMPSTRTTPERSPTPYVEPPRVSPAVRIRPSSTPVPVPKHSLSAPKPSLPVPPIASPAPKSSPVAKTPSLPVTPLPTAKTPPPPVALHRVETHHPAHSVVSRHSAPVLYTAPPPLDSVRRASVHGTVAQRKEAHGVLKAHEDRKRRQSALAMEHAPDMRGGALDHICHHS
jgi:hypothetical protein